MVEGTCREIAIERKLVELIQERLPGIDVVGLLVSDAREEIGATSVEVSVKPRTRVHATTPAISMAVAVDLSVASADDPSGSRLRSAFIEIGRLFNDLRMEQWLSYRDFDCHDVQVDGGDVVRTEEGRAVSWALTVKGCVKISF